MCMLFVISCAVKKDVIVHDEFNPNWESVTINKAEIINTNFKYILDRFENYLDVFERGVNHYRANKLDYFIIVESFCNNDSTFIEIQAKSGRSLFYDFSEEINKRKLDYMFVNKGKVKNTIFLNNDSLPCHIGKDLFRVSPVQEKFNIKYFSKESGEILNEDIPYFREYYYYNGVDFIFKWREYPNLFSYDE